MNKKSRFELWKHLSKRFSLLPLTGKVPIEKNWPKWCVEKRIYRFRNFRGKNAGVACGPASGVIVVDEDHKERFKAMCTEKNWELPETFSVSTGTGVHYYYKYPANGNEYGCRSFKDPDDPKQTIFDIKGLGGQVVAPGSTHPDTGKTYEIITDIEIAPPPEWVLRLALRDDTEPKETAKTKTLSWDGNIDDLPIKAGTKDLIRHGVPKGERSEAIMTVVNALVGSNLSDAEIISIFDEYEIGEKYKEKRRKTKWLQGRIDKGRSYVSKTAPVSAASSRTGKPVVTGKGKKLKTLTFPNQVMTGAAGHFAIVHSKYLEVPTPFLFMGYLTCLGAVLSKNLTIKSELRTQPRLYTMLVGESATDRKSTALSVLDRHFRSVVRGFSSSWGIGSAEGLQKLPEINHADDEPGTILILDEMKSFVHKCKIQNSVLLPCVNTLFESNKYETHTKNSSVTIDDAHLSILGASTLETYERIYNSAFISIGFPNRVFLVVGTAKRRFSFPKEIPVKENYKMESKLIDILKHVDTELKLDITVNARRVYDEWYLNLPPSVHAKRLDGYALRLMMLLAVNNLKHEIVTDTVKNAIALCNWQLEIREEHDPIDADSKIACMEERIRRALKKKGPLTDRELKQKTNANRAGLWVFQSAKRNLKEGDEIIRNSKKKTWLLIE